MEPEVSRLPTNAAINDGAYLAEHANDSMDDDDEICTQCEGDGDVLVDGNYEPCTACDGGGLINNNRR